MRVPRVYLDMPLSEGARIELDDNAFNHCVKVLRLAEGAPLTLFNGDGLEYPAELCEVAKKRASAQLGSPTDTGSESPLSIQVGQAISRGERMDFAIQKSTELGIQRITPLFTERCEVRLNQERQEKRQRHWQQVAISACEQSQRSRVPVIEEPVTLSDWITQVDADLKLVLHHHTARPLASLERPASIALLIGPEGGLTETEVELATQAGFQPVAFGPRVMRTETAPVAAAAVLQYLWGDFG